MSSLDELRAKSATELQKELLTLKREQFNLRMQRGSGPLAKPHRLRELRKQVARIKTLLVQHAQQEVSA